jgi:hypothetical protein
MRRISADFSRKFPRHFSGPLYRHFVAKSAHRVHCVSAVTGEQKARDLHRKDTGFSGVTSRPIMATIGANHVAWNFLWTELL